VWDVVTERDRLVRVPKEGTVLRFEIPLEVEGKVEGAGEKEEVTEKREAKQDGEKEEGTEGREAAEKGIGEEEKEEKKKSLVFELHGDQFIFRAADRASKKFKPHFLPEL
jgi:ribonuclease P protein subunit POP4